MPTAVELGAGRARLGVDTSAQDDEIDAPGEGRFFRSHPVLSFDIVVGTGYGLWCAP
jgi:hypothetical protein